MRKLISKQGVTLLRALQSWCFPSTCRLCGLPGQENMELCEACYRELQFNRYSCRRCAIPLAGEQTDAVCGACLNKPPPYDRAISLLHYRPPASYLIQSLKFHEQLGNADLLANLLAERISRENRPLPDYLVPVPLHTRRLRERGFNQSVLIARILQKRLGIPVLTAHCVRTRNTVSQSKLALKERRHNMRHAFSLRKPLPSGHVAIIDDVVTTGNTVNEVARTLRRGGAQLIEVWSLARA